MPSEQALFAEAVAEHRQGRLAAAQGLYRQVLALAPGHADALHRLGATYLQQNDARQAAELIGQALALNPGLAEAHANMGNALSALRRHEEAAAHFQHALGHMPKSPRLYASLGLALQELRRYPEAAAEYEKALALKPDYAEAHANLGAVLQTMKRFDDAIAHYEKALALKPDYAEARVNLGTALHSLNRDDAAVAEFDRALAARPGYKAAEYYKAFALLRHSKLAEGWRLWESRWGAFPTRPMAEIDRPLWPGDTPVRGRKLLIQYEITLGLGDAIQLARYVPVLEALGAECWVQAPDTLRDLFARSLKRAHVVAPQDCPAAVDCRILFFSLPLALKTFSDAAIPGACPYLMPDAAKAARWRTRLDATKPRIGLIWRSGKDIFDRSATLDDMRPLLANPGVQIVGLQKDVTPAELDRLARYPNALSCGQFLDDMDETAALMAAVDLMISVDTGPVHLAGALARPTWLMLSHAPAWRWLVGRDDSPWYPTMRLFRQQAPGDWQGVVAGIDAALRDFIAAAKR